MKKQTLRSFVKLGTFVFGLSLLLWNCRQEYDNLDVTVEHHHEFHEIYKQKMISISEIPDIENYLYKKIPNDHFNRENNDSGVIMNYDDILQVTDSLGNTSYSIRFVLESSPLVNFLILW